MNVLTTVATFYKEGGMFMHAVLVLGILIVAIVIERSIVIGRAAAINGRKLTDDLVQFAGRGNLAGARNLCAQSSAPLATVATSMIDSGHTDEEGLQIAADDAATLVMPDLSKRIAQLGVFANSATLIGLLGTITGLITAISGVGVADAAQRSAYLASGISEALHTTAFGLMVAIPTLMIQGGLNGRVERIATEIEQLSVRLSKAIAQGAHMAGTASARPRVGVGGGAPVLSAVPRPARAPQGDA